MTSPLPVASRLRLLPLVRLSGVGVDHTGTAPRNASREALRRKSSPRAAPSLRADGRRAGVAVHAMDGAPALSADQAERASAQRSGGSPVPDISVRTGSPPCAVGWTQGPG